MEVTLDGRSGQWKRPVVAAWRGGVGRGARTRGHGDTAPRRPGQHALLDEDGSYTSSTSRAARRPRWPGRQPDRTAAELLAQRAEDRRSTLSSPGHRRRTRQPVAGGASIVPSPRTSAKSRTRRSRRLAIRGLPRERRAISHAPSVSIDARRGCRRPADDRRQLGRVVVVEAGEQPEAVAQRPAMIPVRVVGPTSVNGGKVSGCSTPRALSDDDVELSPPSPVEDLLTARDNRWISSTDRTSRSSSLVRMAARSRPARGRTRRDVRVTSIRRRRCRPACSCRARGARRTAGGRRPGRAGGRPR